DLRGFTALTQRVSPARVVELLNEYYAIVARVIEREGGLITQFLGDGVVAVFGGPLRPLPDHAPHAVRAAIALERGLAQRNAPGPAAVRRGAPEGRGGAGRGVRGRGLWCRQRRRVVERRAAEDQVRVRADVLVEKCPLSCTAGAPAPSARARRR